MSESLLRRMRERIRKKMVKAICDFNMIAEGDRILVAVSGGKDSTALYLLLEDIRNKAPFSFSIHGLMIDQKQPGFNPDHYRHWLSEQGLSLEILEEDTYSVVKEKVRRGKTYCGLCSRLRRGILYTYAAKNGFSKIALGHHRDDLNATLLLNIFYGGTLASMPPKLVSDSGENTVIRPLAYVSEKDIVAFTAPLNIPIIPCNLCGSQSNLKRVEVRKFLHSMELKDKTIGQKILAAQTNIKPSQLCDRNLWRF